MKDRIGVGRFINLPPHNPTQLRYVRFFKNPKSRLESQFTKKKEEWDRMMKDGLKRWYSHYLEV